MLLCPTYRLKDNNLSVVKIADFGLSDFYRPGATMKSSCGTLSFLAPEVFQDTANAGPPLDVWSLGVILFAILNGRLPFEGPDLKGRLVGRLVGIQHFTVQCIMWCGEDAGVPFVGTIQHEWPAR
jgi:serine/threonine protein kinase